MPRLFTGLEIPQRIRQHLALLRAPLARAKWIEPEDMHITLRFAGDLDARTADAFLAQLSEIRGRPCAITIKGVGAFGGREPRVLWAGVEAGGELAALYRANERAARAAGIEPDPRDFKPHVTMARMRGARQKTVARFLEENGDLSAAPFVATQFLLLSARPGSGGPPYGVEETFPLDVPAHEATADNRKE
jgi:RNA 2',3'-cyclic 3'-phosphodiesterase